MGKGGSPARACRLFRHAGEIEREAAFLQERGIASRDFFGNPGAEPSVHAWVPVASVYFRDPDGHSLEYIALLPDKPLPELGVIPPSRWKALRCR